MYCENCGRKVKDGSLFCEYCGAKLPEGTEDDGYKDEYEEEYDDGGDGSRGNTRILIVAAAAAVLVLLVGIGIGVFFYTRGTSLNLNEYLELETDGYEGYAQARVSFDETQFLQDLCTQLKIEENSDDAADLYRNLYTRGLEDGRTECSSDNGRLRDGDTVTYVWQCEEAADWLKENSRVRLEYEDQSYTVSDLPEIRVTDLFEGVEIVPVEGVAGSVMISLEDPSEMQENLIYEVEPSYGLKNGDEVTVTVKRADGGDVADYCRANYGRQPEALETTVTVEGIAGYVASLAEIPDSRLEEMKRQAEDAFDAMTAREWNLETAIPSSPVYIGSYLLTSKTGDGSRLYLIYRIQVRNLYSNGTDSYDQRSTFYWYTAYRNLIADGYGDVSVDVLDYETPGDTFTIDSGIRSGWSNYTWTYKGYQTLTDLYQKNIAVQMDRYTCENGVDDSLAGADSSQAATEPVTTAEATTAAAPTTAETPTTAAPTTAETPTTAAAAASTAAASGAKDSLIFPDSSTRRLTESEVKALSDDELQSAINELWARNGYIFTDKPELNEYYSQYDWYEGKYTKEEFEKKKDDLMSSIEKANENLLASERDSRKKN